MKAVLCTRFGTPDELELADIADPQAGPGEAVVRVKAAALNFFDTLIIAGKYQFKPPFPFSPVPSSPAQSSVGAGVTGFAPGDRVMGHMGWGAAREGGRSFRCRSASSSAAGRARFRPRGRPHRHLRHHAACAQGPRPAQARRDAGVLGASGGTGLAAIELGKLMGARVIACASSDEKLAFARQHGADAGVNYAADRSEARCAGSPAARASTWSTIRSAARNAEPRWVRRLA